MVTNTSKTPKIVILHCDFALSPDFHQVQNRQKSKFRPETLAEVENDLHTTWEVQNTTYYPYMFLVKSGHKGLKTAKNRHFTL